MRAEQEDFDDFITSWRRARLADLSKAELDKMAEELARELSRTALERGHRGALTRACRPYREMSEYVRALYDMATTKHRREREARW